MGVNDVSVQASFNLQFFGLSWNAIFGPYLLGVVMSKKTLFAYCGCLPDPVGCGGDRRRLRAFALGP